jgi:hypothetical protein
MARWGPIRVPPGLDTPWTLIMFDDQIVIVKFGPPGDIILGEKPIVITTITTGHLILIYSDHHKPP